MLSTSHSNVPGLPDAAVIEKDEISSTAQALETQPSDVQSDYVFGWFLSGVNQTAAFTTGSGRWPKENGSK